MDPIELGKKIKEARLAKKMTQSEVVGDFITRNMLSQIESGTATPSVKTLEYLAKTLGLNLTSLMPTEKTSADDTVRRLESTKQLIREGFWREAADLAEESIAMGLMNDEFSALLARAYYELAKESHSEKDYPAAISRADKAYALASKGVYANRSLEADCMLLKAEIAGKLSEFYSEMAKNPK